MWIFCSLFIIFSLLPNGIDSSGKCTKLIETFANSTSEFVSCAIHNSRPITLCENCIGTYINITQTYNTMQEVLDNGTVCINKFINLDRLQIVQTLYSNSYTLWNNAKCYECFEIINGTLTPNKSIETLTFNKNYDEFMACVNRTDINDTTICPTCMENYLKLDKYYNSISDENQKIGVCMDLVDLMNTTRLFWSLKCCKYRQHNEYIFLASSVAVLIITLCFYVVAQFCSVKKAPTILQQTRFAETLNQLNHT